MWYGSRFLNHKPHADSGFSLKSSSSPILWLEPVSASLIAVFSDLAAYNRPSSRAESDSLRLIASGFFGEPFFET
jgi:hypothetical protein